MNKKLCPCLEQGKIGLVPCLPIKRCSWLNFDLLHIQIRHLSTKLLYQRLFIFRYISLREKVNDARKSINTAQKSLNNEKSINEALINYNSHESSKITFFGSNTG